MVIDGAIGGISGAIGGAGKGTKHLMNLGKQSLKRTVGTTINKGVRAGVREAAKAAVYYGKNTSRYYSSYVRGLLKDTASAIVTSVASSNYMKNQYRRALGR